MCHLKTKNHDKDYESFLIQKSKFESLNFFQVNSSPGILTPKIEGVGVGVDVDYTDSYSYT
jgi:hypothetical protein